MENILVYRDRLLPRSERAFMRRQYIGFTHLRPNWVGCHAEADIAAAGITPRLIGGGNGLRQFLFKQFAQVGAEAEIRALSPQLVHAQFGRGGALALPLARALRVPLVVTFHGGDVFKNKHFERRLIPTIFQRRWQALQEYAALFVCVSEGVRARLLERGVPAHKLEVLHIGVENVAVSVALEAPRHFVFAGRFVEKKGIFVLADAIRRMRAAGNTTPVILAGDGPLMTSVKTALAEVPDVRLAGWLAQGEMQALLRAAYAVVIPSIQGGDGDAEGLPSVAMEALGLGVPVIGSDATWLQNVMAGTEAGVIVPAGDAELLAQAMLRVAGDGAHMHVVRSNAAHRLACVEFVAERQSRRLEDRLLSVIQDFKGG